MEEVKEGEKCCAKGKCCGAKALVALLLVGAGWTGGYFCAKGCAAKAAASAPANPAK